MCVLMYQMYARINALMYRCIDGCWANTLVDLHLSDCDGLGDLTDLNEMSGLNGLFCVNVSYAAMRQLSNESNDLLR